MLVLSGKGGVGKSTVAVNLTFSLVGAGKHVGLLDVDIHGPSVPRMLGLKENVPHEVLTDLVPVKQGALKVKSIGFLLPSADEAVIWRGPMTVGLARHSLHFAVTKRR